MTRTTMVAAGFALALLIAGVPAQASQNSDSQKQDTGQNGQQKQQRKQEQKQEQKKDAKQLLDGAVQVVQQMKQDPEAAKALSEAKGVFLAPDFGRGAFIVGGRGGQGVLVTKNDAEWGKPAFFNFGTVSVGAQAGASAGQVAMLLMTDDAVNSFKQENNFSLNADAGLTLIGWSANVQSAAGKGDIVFWSDTEGVFGGGAISVSDIYANDTAIKAYYRGSPDAEKILSGKAETNKSDPLKDVLP